MPYTKPTTDLKFKTVINKNTFYFFNPAFEEKYEGYLNSLKEILLILKNEIETKGFARYDFAVHSSLIDIKIAKFQIFGGVENIGDRSYRNHLSTNRGAIDIEPGRNMYIKLKIQF